MRRFGLGFGLPYRGAGGGAAASASQQILGAVTALDSDASVYDPDNPETWTLRESGGSQFYSEVTDGMGNRTALVQATESAQPVQKTLSTGRKVWDAPTRSKYMLADFASTIAQPNTVVCVSRIPSIISQDVLIDSNGASGGRQQMAGQVSDPGKWRQFAGTIADRQSGRTNEWQFNQFNFNGASSQHFIDGVQNGSDADVGAAGLGGVGILAVAISNTNALASLGPVIVFSGAKTNAELADLRTIINAAYPIGISE